ncbi:MAG: single-stranded DNA-binding protein [Bacillota bacterium]
MPSGLAAASPSVQKLLIQAVREAGSLKSGEEFLVSDLFKGYEWKRIPIKDRLLLGSLVLAECNNNNTGFTPSRKNRSNLQIYRKI